MSHSYQDLICWNVAKELAVSRYKWTEPFPKSEMFGLRGQLRRAAVSVVSNIAEGQGRLTSGEFLQFLGHSRGSLLELETQFIICEELKLISKETLTEALHLTRRVAALLNRLIESLKSDAPAPQRETRNVKRETTKC